MLTGYQAEIVAFIGDGEFVCYDCAHTALDQGEFTAAENGLGSLSPVCRYSIDEIDGERAYEEANEIARERGIEPDNYEAIDAIVAELGDTLNEVCGNCGEVLA